MKVKFLKSKGVNMDLMTEQPISPGDGITDMLKEQRENEEEQTRLDAKFIENVDDDFSLFSWGWSQPLKRTRSEMGKKGQINTRVEYFRLKIKSIGMSEVMEEWQNKMPTPPAMIKAYKKDSDVARQLGQKHEVVVWEINEADPSYQRERQRFNSELGKALLLHSLAYDIKDRDGRLVLRGDSINEPNQVIDSVAALNIIFNRWGLTSEHFAAITGDVRKLTEAKEEQELGE